MPQGQAAALGSHAGVLSQLRQLSLLHVQLWPPAETLVPTVKLRQEVLTKGAAHVPPPVAPPLLAPPLLAPALAAPALPVKPAALLPPLPAPPRLPPAGAPPLALPAELVAPPNELPAAGLPPLLAPAALVSPAELKLPPALSSPPDAGEPPKSELLPPAAIGSPPSPSAPEVGSEYGIGFAQPSEPVLTRASGQARTAPRTRYWEKVAGNSLTIKLKLTHLAERPVLISGRNLDQKCPARVCRARARR